MEGISDTSDVHVTVLLRKSCYSIHKSQFHSKKDKKQLLFFAVSLLWFILFPLRFLKLEHHTTNNVD